MFSGMIQGSGAGGSLVPGDATPAPSVIADAKSKLVEVFGRQLGDLAIDSAALASIASSLADDIVAAAALGREDLVSDIVLQARAYREVYRIEVNASAWEAVETVVETVAAVATALLGPALQAALEGIGPAKTSVSFPGGES